MKSLLKHVLSESVNEERAQKANKDPVNMACKNHR